MITRVYILGVTMIAASCSGQAVTVGDFPGVYEMKHRHGFDHLELFADGTFRHTSTSVHKIDERGKWKVDAKRDRPCEVNFDGYTPGADESWVGATPPAMEAPLIWSASCEKKMNGRLEFEVNDDLGLKYEKLKQSGSP